MSLARFDRKGVFSITKINGFLILSTAVVPFLSSAYMSHFETSCTLVGMYQMLLPLQG